MKHREHDDTAVQHFKQPHDVITPCGSCLPVADCYLIHPSLQSLVFQHRAGDGYGTFRYLAVGHGYRWRYYFPELIALQRDLAVVTEKDLRQAVLSFMERNLNPQNDDAEPCSDEHLPVYHNLQLQLEEKGHDAVYIALEDFMQCIRKGHRG